MIKQILSNYADVISEFAIPMVIAIFALAFPLLFQTASRIDDKYNSTLLIKVFRKDRICKWFIYTLLGALICCGLWILQLPRLIDCGEFINILIDNSALILLLVSTFVLVVMTICSMWLMYVYYMPDKLLERLIEQYHSAQTKDKKIYFEAISKILFYSIKKEGEPLARQLQLFYCKEFISCREDKENKIIEYPDFFYDVVFDANECLCQRERKSISWYHDSFYDFFIDEFQHTVISDKTFSFIWKCLRQSVFYQKDEFIFSYWRKAHQYMNFWLKSIYPKYDKNFNTTNQEDIDRRNAERKRFLEFHYALGGLLMMKQKYTLINQLTSWTNQTPPKYVLVPETMEEVIKMFMEVEQKGGYTNSFYYEQKYPFPDISGVNANNIIKMWIKRYIAILFLRQYTLHEYFVYSRTLEMPNPPQTLSEKRCWLEELDILKRFVLEYLSDISCLKSLNLEALSSPDWFTNNNKTKPDELIEGLKNKVEYSAEQKKANQKLDQKKIEQLNDASKKILTNCFDYYEQLFRNHIADSEPHKSLFYGGRYEISDKMAFAEDQDMCYANFDSIYAEIIATEFRHNMPSVFRVYYKTTYYILAEKDIFLAIDNLQLDCQKFTIVSVGVNLYSYNLNGVTTEENRLWKYNDIPIVELGNTQIDAVNNSLFVMLNEDLPCVLHNEINEEIINKYGLNHINDKYHIYTNVIDLHENSVIQNEVREKTNIQDLDKSVLVCVDVNTEVRCKMDAKCVQLKVFSQFDNIGNPNVPEDVKNIWSE